MLKSPILSYVFCNNVSAALSPAIMLVAVVWFVIGLIVPILHPLANLSPVYIFSSTKGKRCIYWVDVTPFCIKDIALYWTMGWGIVPSDFYPSRSCVSFPIFSLPPWSVLLLPSIFSLHVIRFAGLSLSTSTEPKLCTKCSYYCPIHVGWIFFLQDLLEYPLTSNFMGSGASKYKDLFAKLN